MSRPDFKARAVPASYRSAAPKPGGQVTFALPYPPSVNAIWRSIVVRGRVRVVLSREGRNYRSAAHAQLDLDGIGRPLVGPLGVEVRVYRPRRIGDLDNSAKAVLDALKGRVFIDDAQVVDLHLLRFDDKANPRVEVLVRQMPQERDEELPATGGLEDARRSTVRRAGRSQVNPKEGQR